MLKNPYFLLGLIYGVVFSPLIYLEYKKNHNINESYAITATKIFSSSWNNFGIYVIDDSHYITYRYFIIVNHLSLLYL